jgi:hypothetical protein
LYSSPSTIIIFKTRTKGLAWYVARMGRRRMNKYWWKSQRERITKETKTICVDAIKTDLRKREIGCIMDWIDLAEDAI